MRITVYSFLWIMQDLYHQPYLRFLDLSKTRTKIRTPKSKTLDPQPPKSLNPKPLKSL